MYQYYNPNPKSNRVGDCVIRAISCATGKTWDETYAEVCAYGYALKDMPSANMVWGKYLSDKGWIRHIVDCDCDVEHFCEAHPKGTYILAIQGHVVCVKDGCYCDSWNSGQEIPLYYWEENN